MRTYTVLHGRDESPHAPSRSAAAGREGGTRSSSASRMRFRDDRKRVMVVDDEDSIRELTAAWLSDEGFLVATARNGADALRQLRDFCPDVIVLDLMMPVMDGWAFAEACRRVTGAVEIPIIVVSAGHGLVQASEQLRAFGVRACLAKPFDLEMLAATAATLAEREEAVIAAAS